MIELKGVTSGYGGIIKLNIDSLAVKDGEITTVIGRNGSGKSTLLKTIDAQIGYTGSVKADGREMKDLPHKERARIISYLPQTLLPVNMTVETLVSHGRFAYGDFSNTLKPEDREHIDNAIRLADLEAYRKRTVSALSGGERTRAYLAMIIAQNSKYVLLDEPMSDLDIPHQKQICSILKELSQNGIGVLIASHDMPLSFEISDRICVMGDGEKAAFGTPADLAADRELLEKCIGAAVGRVNDKHQLYGYALMHNGRE